MASSSREQYFVLTGFSGEPTRGSCTVLSFDRAGRWQRALRTVGKWWGLAFLCVFIPVAHFVLVPTFLALGLYQFTQRLGTSELTLKARGTCPDCGVEQALEVAPHWRVPQQVACTECHRGLKLSL